MNGSLNVETVTISSASTVVTVLGCANITGYINLDLTSVVAGSKKTVLIQKGDNCSSSLSSATVKVIDKSKDCRKRSLTISSDSSSQILTVLISVNDSGCKSNKKWIIIGCVVAIVAVLLVVGLILLFTLNKSAREWVRPFSSRRDTVVQSKR